MTENWGDPDPNRTWRQGTEPPPADQWSYFPPPGMAPTPWQPPVPEPLLPRLLRAGTTFAATTGVVVLLGAPLALLWRAVAPTAVILRTADGPQPAAPESDQVFATDGWFVLVSLVVGAVVGALAWFALRSRGPAAPTGLAAGGLLAGLVAAAVGRRLVVDQYLYDFCHAPGVRCLIYDGTLYLHATAAVVVLPAAMLTAFVLMTFVFDRRVP